MTTQRLRFSVNWGGQQSEIFSVRERSNGDLLILFKRSENYEWNGENRRFLQERYSVHVSPKSPGNLVKKTDEIEGGILIESASYYIPGEDGFICPMFAQTVPDLGLEKYRLKRTGKDRVVYMHPSDISNCTMVYGIIATSGIKEIIIPADINAGLFNFSKLGIILLFGFIAMPPIGECDKLMFMTSMIKINGSNDAELVIKDKPSPSLANAVSQIRAAMSGVSAQLIDRHIRIFEEGGQTVTSEMVDQMEFMSRIMLNDPIPSDQ